MKWACKKLADSNDIKILKKTNVCISGEKGNGS